MAKYNDRYAYLLKILPILKDSFLITDFEDNNATKTVEFQKVLDLFIQAIVDGSNALSQNNKFRFVNTTVVIGGPGAELPTGNLYELEIISKLNTNFQSIDLEVLSDQLIIFKVQVVDYGTFKTHERKYFFPNLMGKGDYFPLATLINANNLEIAYIQTEEIIATPEVIQNSPNNVVFDLGDITGQDYLQYINEYQNTSLPNGYDLNDTSKIYYFRFIDNDVIYLYYFDSENSLNGFGYYGIDGDFIFQNGELILFFQSDVPNTPIPVGISQSLAQTLTIGGRGIRTIGTDSVLQTADKSKFLICNNEDFSISIPNAIGSVGDKFLILNPSNAIPPSIGITGSSVSIFYNGEEKGTGDSITIPLGSELSLICIATNTYFLSIKAIGSAGSPTLQDVVTEGGEVISTDLLSKIVINKETNSISFFGRANTSATWVNTGNISGGQISLSQGAFTFDGYNFSILQSDFNLTYIPYVGLIFNDGTNETIISPTSATKNGVEFATVNNVSTEITNLKDGVASPGDTLQKLYNLILGASAEVSVANIAARNAYNVPHLPFSIFVIDDGDGKWAKYQATTTGVGATFVKLSDPDLLNAVMNAAAIKAAYESNSDTNAFTNALKAIVENQSGVNTGDETLATIVSKLGFMPDKPVYYRSLNADYTGTGSTAAQKAFNVGANGDGAYTVLANKKYKFRTFIYVEGLSSTSGTISIAVLGTANIDMFNGPALAKKTGSAANPAGPQSTLINSAPQAVVTATTTTTGYLFVEIDFTTISSGTFIPAFICSISAAPVFKKGNWAALQELGASSLTTTPD